MTATDCLHDADGVVGVRELEPRAVVVVKGEHLPGHSREVLQASRRGWTKNKFMI